MEFLLFITTLIALFTMKYFFGFVRYTLLALKTVSEVFFFTNSASFAVFTIKIFLYYTWMTFITFSAKDKII